MTAIDHLLARALLLKEPKVPSDTVPYEDTAYPAFAPDGTPPWISCGRESADDTAARHLQTLCEVAVTHATPDQVADFITEQVPTPRSAWILGCVLLLADAPDGARFWWQYAAGGGSDAASYCLYLHHRALGDSHAAAFWLEQSGIDRQDCDTSVPTVLRILRHLIPAAGRSRTEAMIAVMDYVSGAVAAGYARNPDYEIPLPGPDFAEQIGIILAVTSTVSKPSRHEHEVGAAALPNRPPLHPGENPAEERGREPERVLEVEAVDNESAAILKEAIAACWETATADLTAPKRDRPGVRLRYYLDRRPLIDALRTSGTRATQPS
ncbi:DUF6207 family protein (plasmid) [Streptomyces sp. NBC_00440]|uniref:DUF6207 family protein n=1 Tax=Streptomyces sp. NBC_00440 TaxID=2975741 RepID=UPI002E1B02DA